MRWARELRQRFLATVHRVREEAEMDEELSFHLEMETRRNLDLGMAPEEARRRAVIAFGGVQKHREAVRDARGLALAESVWRDIGYAARSLRRSPGFTLVTVLTLGLGIGSGVAMFGITRLATQPIAFADPDRLFSLSIVGERGFARNPTLEEFETWERAADGVADLGAFAYGSRSIGDEAGTTYAYGVQVTPGFFPVLGALPAIGRGLLPEDFHPGVDPTAVISARLWRGRFAGDPDILGRTIELDGRVHVVVGVLPDASRFPAPVDVWTPMSTDAGMGAETIVTVIGRRSADASADALTPVIASAHAAFSAERAVDPVRIEPGPLMGRMAEESDLGIAVLRGIVLVLLMIGVTNAAGMIVSRSIERGRETAVRASLGASRARLFRQSLTETGLLATFAGMLGLAVAFVLLTLLRAWLPAELAEQILGWDGLGTDGYAIAVAFVLSAMVTIGAGVVPAWRVARRDPSADLKRGPAGGMSGRSSGRLSRAVVAGQVAAALTLLLVAALLARNFSELLRLPSGFESRGLAAVEWEVPADQVPGGAAEVVSRFQDPLRARLAGEPGVEPVGFVTVPPVGGAGPTSRYLPEGSDSSVAARSAAWRAVSPGYLEAMGIPLIRGRSFGAMDHADAPRVVVVSDAFARREWPDGPDPLGRSLVIEGRGNLPWTIVGVAADVRGGGIDGAAEPTLYAPIEQAPVTRGYLVIRVDDRAEDVVSGIQRAIWSVDPNVVAGPVESFDQALRDRFASEMALATITGFFAVLALAITLHSLLALVVQATMRRRREIGIRMALGATERRIVRQNVLGVMGWVTLGVAAGVAAAAAVARAVESLLVGIDPLDPIAFAALPVFVLGVSLLACWIPARSAVRVTPAVTLRAE